MLNFQILNQTNDQTIFIPFNKNNYEFLCLLEKEGYLIILNKKELILELNLDSKRIFIKIKKLDRVLNKKINKNSINIEKYSIKSWHIKQISKPSRKVYHNYSQISKLYKYGLGTSIFKTSKGYLTDKECIWHKLGGEYLFCVF
tara:strand:- start:1185 stop:1616 length:432 start_codon:yes stop_codon:yes gene_type:complete